MHKYNKIETKALIKTLFTRFFCNKFTNTTFDLLMTTLIAIHTAKIDLASTSWLRKLFIYVIITLFLKFMSILADIINSSNKSDIKGIYNAYEVHSSLNNKVATNLYRINKRIIKVIRSRSIEKGEMNSIAGFQKLSFDICNELHRFLIEDFNCESCEVTIFQRFTDENNKDFVRMIAYKNSENSIPSSYSETFKLYHKTTTDVPVFVDVFNDLNADAIILHNKRMVERNFLYFENSKTRENKINQYIGIPIKTNRNKIEIVLQIDSSKKNAFGKNYNDVKQFVDIIIKPFTTLLHCSFERDIILCKFYDILEENIKTRVNNEKSNN